MSVQGKNTKSKAPIKGKVVRKRPAAMGTLVEDSVENSKREELAKVAGEQTKQAEEKANQAKEQVKERLRECIVAIQETIGSIPYHAAPAVGVTLHPAALTSCDGNGYPSTRTVVPNAITADLSEVKMTTRKGTRKEAEIKANGKVALHFQDQRGRGGWVTLKGTATIGPGAQADHLDVVMKVSKAEAMSYVVEGLRKDEEGWKPVLLNWVDGEWNFVEA